ncbi:MAG: hypothetical protein WCA89_04565 [Terracidiphilus sp.]
MPTDTDTGPSGVTHHAIIVAAMEVEGVSVSVTNPLFVVVAFHVSQ